MPLAKLPQAHMSRSAAAVARSSSSRLRGRHSWGAPRSEPPSERSPQAADVQRASSGRHANVSDCRNCPSKRKAHAFAACTASAEARMAHYQHSCLLREASACCGRPPGHGGVGRDMSSSVLRLRSAPNMSAGRRRGSNNRNCVHLVGSGAPSARAQYTHYIAQ